MEKVNWLTTDKIAANTDKTLMVLVRDSGSLNHSAIKSPKLVTEHKQQKYIHTIVDGKVHSFGGGTEVFFE